MDWAQGRATAISAPPAPRWPDCVCRHLGALVGSSRNPFGRHHHLRRQCHGAPLHMPVVLGREHFEAWLDCKTTELKAAQDMLWPAPDDFFEAVEMHPQINDSRRDEPGIQQPLETQLLL
jgi:hypothetical protein